MEQRPSIVSRYLSVMTLKNTTFLCTWKLSADVDRFWDTVSASEQPAKVIAKTPIRIIASLLFIFPSTFQFLLVASNHRKHH
jgi:hypothetical protein